MTPKGVKLTNITMTHHKTSLVNVTPDKFNLKWEIDSNIEMKGIRKQISNGHPSQLHVQRVQSSYLELIFEST